MKKQQELLINAVGLAEASEMIGVSKQAVYSYIKRGVFPTPIKGLKATPLWSVSQIEKYIDERNRNKKVLKK